MSTRIRETAMAVFYMSFDPTDMDKEGVVNQSGEREYVSRMVIKPFREWPLRCQVILILRQLARIGKRCLKKWIHCEDTHADKKD